MDDKSVYFGEEHPLFFFYHGIPFSVGGWIVFLYLGFFILVCAWKFPITKTNRAKYDIFLLFLVPIIVYSLSNHKESRSFVYILLIFLIIFRFMTVIYPLFPIISSVFAVLLTKLNFHRFLKLFIVILCIVNVIFFTVKLFTKSGSLSLTDYVRNQPNINKVLFISGCYESPFYSHFHK